MISLIHPSRSRPEKAYKTCYDWLDRSGLSNVEYILSLDRDDPEIDKYDKLLGARYSASIINNNNSVVDATNRAAKLSTGEILVYVSDDFKCPLDWGNLLIKEFSKYSGPTLIKVDDCLQRFDTAVLTIPIMNRECYESLGYFFHPGYKSMFCDEHLYWRTRKLGYLQYAPHLKFEHCHVSVGKAEDDETYRRSAANWDQGKALFKQHQAAGFPV